MKVSSLVLTAMLFGTAAAMPVKQQEKATGVLPKFEEYVSKFSKSYVDDAEFAARKAIYELNLEKINYRNKFDTATHGVNEFSDLDEDEFKQMFTGYKPADLSHMENIPKAPKTAYGNGTTPTEWDWRDHGAVTPVKNQGSCGSCWAFSTTGDVEGSWFLAGNDLTSFSEQELVDCDHNGDMGCNGGLPSQAMDWIEQNGGLEEEGSYPYTGMDGTCSFDKSKAVGTITGSEQVSQDEDDIAAYLAVNGPLSIGIDAAWMQSYIGGIACPWVCSKTALDHGVMIVGYGKGGLDIHTDHNYWTIKNSWGDTWGEDGYYKICRGKGACGLNTMVVHSKQD